MHADLPIKIFECTVFVYILVNFGQSWILGPKIEFLLVFHQIKRGTSVITQSPKNIYKYGHHLFRDTALFFQKFSLGGETYRGRQLFASFY